MEVNQGARCFKIKVSKEACFLKIGESVWSGELLKKDENEWGG
jgi:hypothetical protein